MDTEGKGARDIEERVYLSLLYDFYGALLKENQRQMLEGYLLEDFSISEIAENMGITRQGVHDGIKRSTRQLREYEAKLGLAARFEQQKERMKELKDRLERQPVQPRKAEWREILDLLEEIVEG